ncbi:MurR/RpiR family transcriptional regulator [Amaricoccus tamworthensis]|uniref:MurR/RpiR family transcriptional regulator n=1 Tax=Amaricoccus tamworthensis TaxID=57002 RepID=UPI003C7DE375
MQRSFEQQLSTKYSGLSTKLREAAEFVLEHPVDVATRSLRAVSKDANLSPATFSRMSTALGYDSYEELRDTLRRSVEHRVNSFSDRMEALQEDHDEGDTGFLTRHVHDCSTNVQLMERSIDPNRLEACVDRLHRARRVLVFGALGSTGVAEYLVYMASFLTEKWSMANPTGASLASKLVGMSGTDVLIVITKPPFASRAIRAAREAQAAGAYVLVLTDTWSCPALAHASASFVVPTDSRHFFSSYASTLVLCEIIIGMLAGRAGPPARRRIREVEDRNRSLSEVWEG